MTSSDKYESKSKTAGLVDTAAFGGSIQHKGSGTDTPLESVHGSVAPVCREGRVRYRHCKMIGCERVFCPKRKNQRFCSAECRSAYFSLARKLGVAVIEGLKAEEAWAVEALHETVLNRNQHLKQEKIYE